VKYLGKKSMSSFLSGFFHVWWYIVFLFAVIAGLFGTYLLLVPLDDPTFLKMATCMELNLQDKDWVFFKNLPLAVRLLFLPYFAAIVVFMLQITKKLQDLFTNFKNDIVFNKSNVFIISKISKLNIVLSILTFSFSSLLVSLFLFMLCEIFKSGTALQEEHDLTV
jgi:hypothetical protein